MPSQPHVHDAETHLHVCGACASPLVQPMAWERAGGGYWQITLRCPECESVGTGVFDDDVVQRFELELERGETALATDLAVLTQAAFEAEAEAFIGALHAGFVLPEDF